jgi:hypothetical protein
MIKRDLQRAGLFGLAASLPISGAIVAAQILTDHGIPQPSASPVALAPSTPQASPIAENPSPLPSPSVTPTTRRPAPVRTHHIPQGSVSLVQHNETAATNKCSRVVAIYENRSDTAVISITQSFQTTYTPKHRDGEYPDDKNGPVKTLTQTAGIPPYGTRQVTWDVCAPELAKLMNPYHQGETDSWMNEMGSVPTKLHWAWHS